MDKVSFSCPKIGLHTPKNWNSLGDFLTIPCDILGETEVNLAKKGKLGKMGKLQKSILLLMLGSTLLLPYAGNSAAAQSMLTAAAVDGETTEDIDFPGEIRVTSVGIVRLDIRMPDEYADAAFALLVKNERGKEVKRIRVDAEDEEYDLKGLNLAAGEYEILLEMKLGDETVFSNTASWKVAREYDEDEPPGSIEVEYSGTIWVNVEQNRADRGEGSFYVVVKSDRSDKVVRRFPIAPKDVRISASSMQLGPGEYEVYLEWAKDNEVLRSARAIWEIKQAAPRPLPAGEDFPGSIMLHADGTIEVSLHSQQIPVTAQSYLLVYDQQKTEIKRIKLDRTQPAVSKRDLSLSTGGYQLVLELVDLVSSQSSQSDPVFFPVNLTEHPVVFLDGKLQSYAQSPIVIQGKTFVPLRAIFEALGAEVQWDQADSSVKAVRGGQVVEIAIGSHIAYVNGQKTTLEEAPRLHNGTTTMVPLRFVSEALGAKVEWEPSSRSVVIYK